MLQPEVALESGFVDTNGIRLHFLRSGGPSGRPVVLLHGNTHCGGIFAPLMESLAARGFSCTSGSLRGHGFSDKPQSGYDWATLKDDIVGLMDALALEQPLFVSHSRGGGVSLVTALYHPDRVRGIVAFEPTVPLRREGAAPANMRYPAGLIERTGRRRTSFPSREFLYDYYRARDLFRNWRDEYVWAYIDHGHAPVEGGIERLCPGWVEGKLYEAMVDDTPWRGRSAPQTPLLLVYGERSGRVGPGRDPFAPIRASFPLPRIEVMTGASHFGPMEFPEEFERLILEFEQGLRA